MTTFSQKKFLMEYFLTVVKQVKKISGKIFTLDALKVVNVYLVRYHGTYSKLHYNIFILGQNHQWNAHIQMYASYIFLSYSWLYTYDLLIYVQFKIHFPPFFQNNWLATLLPIKILYFHVRDWWSDTSVFTSFK